MKKLDPSEFWFEDILKSNAATHICLRWEIRRERIKRGILNIDDSSRVEFLSRPYMDRNRNEAERMYDYRTRGNFQRDNIYDECEVDENGVTTLPIDMKIRRGHRGMFCPMWVIFSRFRDAFKELGEALDSAEKKFKSMRVSEREYDKRLKKWEDMMDQQFGWLKGDFDTHDYRAFLINWDMSKENLMKEFQNFLDDNYETHGQTPASLPGGGDRYRKMRADLVHLARARLWKFYVGNIDKCHLSVGESTSEYAQKILASERTYNNSLDRIIELCESEEYQW